MPERADHETAAILLMLLDEEEAAAIVERLDPAEIERVGGAMFALHDVDEHRVAVALDCFVQSAKDCSTMTSEVSGHLSGVMTRALGGDRAPAMLERIIPEAMADPLPTLKWLSVDDLVSLCATEHPQFTALLIANLAPAAAAAVIARMDDADQADILYRAATLGPVSAQAFADADALLANHIGAGKAGRAEVNAGAPAIAAILNHVPRALDLRMMRALGKLDRPLAQRIDDDRVVFDDLLGLSDKDLGTLCRTTDATEMTLALKGVTDAQRERIFATMSARAADTMRDAIAEQGPTKLADVQAAQRAIIILAKSLSDSGAIQLGKGDGDYV
ncbi:FliG C-terminal domain-containing protein [Sphingomonas sp.]|uniref:FliG C-terminal domain-containing protein n=1 Tax=Sphingomonas sp. TaxID=28214 RepID=UPI0025E1BB7C|nr:FliG C-terminal domain-containing protein [Sphingomonas sp.]